MTSLFPLLPYFNLLFAVGSIVLLAATMLLLYTLHFRPTWLAQIKALWVWLLIFAVTIGGVVMSLVYSEIFLFVPCSLCWLQRIALYPQALLAIMAYRRGDTVHFPVYGIALSTFGMIVATYQYIYQMVPAETRSGVMPCLADGSADCADKVIDMFGFVTFPFISAVSFAFLIALYQYLRRSSN
ncbi:MAG: disulfide bond formation protein B [Candidatus Pacebacteria bacterium]|jgi:disulfide bond formation protein DsbB|nr:disulfide bond formation protein B [Candidatus Paceibacterota bacterium]